MEPTNANIGISGLGQIAIVVHDVARATAFYKDALGLKLLFTAGGMSFFDCGGVRLMLSLPEKPEFDHPSSILYFTVADIAVAHQRLLENGTQFESGPHIVARMPASTLWVAFFRDTEQNFLALMSEVSVAA